ncbi:hypothetical protein FYJ85_09960 [Victivallaceae bacterium BBE-744-WT-12]|uniref:Alpha-L-rhamnosidase-like protein n=1 Tax=Victivallis lenta TaxID=2606640 RepID=A0A844G1X6_9BACT|nr:hypothetical protein [Victivallis lenta]MST97366.1 hypothetical protein [Victivallis lenta]
MLDSILSRLPAPGKEFRGAPFWAWNGKLEPQELRRQINDFRGMGFGGFFMHSRVGLNTEYLGREWFECVRACIDEAKKCGMDAWLYDEDRWPSGAAGGLVTRNPEYRSRFIQCISGDEARAEDGCRTLGCFAAADLNARRCSSFRRLESAGEPLAENETLLRFRLSVAPDSSWFNGEAYLDVLNEKAVEEFIRVTHERYRAELGSEFGGTVPGIFSDEPNFRTGFLPGSMSMPWTESLPQTFAELSGGMKLSDRLPELFFKVGDEDFSPVRMHYYNTLTHLFVNAFSRRIGAWCEKNNLLFTGHVLLEDNVVSQSSFVGSAMRFYEYMQSPGIDLLTEHWNIFLAAKQCVSAARQFGRSLRLSETYGCTGWDFPFAGHKALGDWQTALGINFFCPHLAWYTMEGEGKRDYPAGISSQSPWFESYHRITDYFARINLALSGGAEVRDLLVVHPIESTWGVFYEGRDSAEPEWNTAEENRLVHLTNFLLGQHLDFDFGDEEIMARHGAAEEAGLRIGQAVYQAVLLPEMRTIRRSTLELLTAFRRNGGTVCFLGAPPERTDGAISGAAAEAYRNFRKAAEHELAAALGPAVRHLSIAAAGTEAESILCQLRRHDDCEVLFCCNTGVEMRDRQMEMPLVRDRNLEYPAVRIAWKLPAAYRIYEIDPSSGEIFPVDGFYENGCRAADTSFAALQSRLFIAAQEIPACRKRRDAAPGAPVVEIPAGVPLPVRRSEPNVLLLAEPEYRIDGGGWQASEPVLKLDDRLRERLGARPRGGEMIQPWLAPRREPERKLALELKYEFDCRDIPPEECRLALERPELYEAEFNGVPIAPLPDAWWVDRSLRLLALPRALFVQGRNRITLRTAYHAGMPGLEYCYLLGEFAVGENAVLTAPPQTLVRGDWTKQGLPYYSGNLTYRFDLPDGTADGTVLELGPWRGTAVLVSVNGGKAAMAAWPPYRTVLTGLTGRGDRVEVTILGHRRNSHGPFYLKDKWPVWTGPFEFRKYETGEPQLVPAGLL